VGTLSEAEADHKASTWQVAAYRRETGLLDLPWYPADFGPAGERVWVDRDRGVIGVEKPYIFLAHLVPIANTATANFRNEAGVLLSTSVGSKAPSVLNIARPRGARGENGR
jgi:hypothetical protein